MKGIQIFACEFEIDRCRFRVIGPQCIQYALNNIETGSIHSKGYPFYIMSMRNICVTLTGFEKEEQVQLEELTRFVNLKIIN